MEVDYVGVPVRLTKPPAGVVTIHAGRPERTVTLVTDPQPEELRTEDVEVDPVVGQWSFLGPAGDLDLDKLNDVVCRQLAH